MARLSRPKCHDPVLLGSLTIVSTRIISSFFFALPQLIVTRGTTSYGICWLSIQAPFSYYQRDGIAILAQGGLVISHHSTISSTRQISPLGRVSDHHPRAGCAYYRADTGRWPAPLSCRMPLRLSEVSSVPFSSCTVRKPGPITCVEV